MGVELVHDQHDLLRIPVAPLQQQAHEARPVRSAAMLSDFDVAPACQRFAGQKQARSPVAGVDVVKALD